MAVEHTCWTAISLQQPPAETVSTMRALLALGLLIALSVCASAATIHRAKSSILQLRTRQHVIVGPSQSGAVPPGWYKFPGYPPIPPEQNRNLDPSTFGG